MADEIHIGGSAIGSAIGTGASVRVGQVIAAVHECQRIDDELKRKLALAAEGLQRLALPEGDKQDIADDLAKLTSELNEPERDAGRIGRVWNRIKDAAPTLASLVASAESLGKIVGAIR